MTYIKVEKGKRIGGTVYRQLKLRTEACGHITDVSTLIVKRAGIRRSSEDRHAAITFPVNLASVPKFCLGNREIVSLQNVKPLVLCRMPLHDIAEVSATIIAKKRTRTRTCSSRSAPGSTVTSATAILFEILKVVESTILTDPPLSCVALTLDNG
jgi:hypothetical protein